MTKSIKEVLDEALAKPGSTSDFIIQILYEAGYIIVPEKAEVKPSKESGSDANPQAILGKLAIAEEKLRKIGDIYNKEYKDKSGHTIMTHMGYNLQAAIIDLKNGKNDQIVINTLDGIGNQIANIAKELGPDLIWDKEPEKLKVKK